MAYDIGDTIRTSASFTVNGVATDPTTVAVSIKSPSGVTTTYTWAASQVTRNSAGNFQFDFLVTEAGRWFARWVGTGAAAATREELYDVIPSGVLGGSTLDVITLAEGRAAINMHASDTSQDTEIAAYITAVSLRLDQLVGPVVVRTVTAEVHDAYGATVQLDHYPVSSVTSVTEYVGATGTVLTAEAVGAATTANDYTLDARWGILTRRSSATDVLWSLGRSRVVVTYVAGRFATTATVSQLFKTAATIMLAHLWRREQSADPMTAYQRSHGLAVPKVVKEMLGDEWRLPAVA